MSGYEGLFLLFIICHLEVFPGNNYDGRESEGLVRFWVGKGVTAFQGGDYFEIQEGEQL